MKKIEAIIRKTKFEEVKEALNKAGIEFFTFWDVRGIGNAHEGRIYRGVAYDTSTIERILISIYCREKFVTATVDAIMNAAKTGEIGDGKIFISDIIDAYRIRTGEEGDKSLYNPGGE
jgi:nitrogen regulatory protein P-II 1